MDFHTFLRVNGLSSKMNTNAFTSTIFKDMVFVWQHSSNYMFIVHENTATMLNHESKSIAEVFVTNNTAITVYVDGTAAITMDGYVWTDIRGDFAGTPSVNSMTKSYDTNGDAYLICNMYNNEAVIILTFDQGTMQPIKVSRRELSVDDVKAVPFTYPLMVVGDIGLHVQFKSVSKSCCSYRKWFFDGELLVKFDNLRTDLPMVKFKNQFVTYSESCEFSTSMDLNEWQAHEQIVVDGEKWHRGAARPVDFVSSEKYIVMIIGDKFAISSDGINFKTSKTSAVIDERPMNMTNVSDHYLVFGDARHTFVRGIDPETLNLCDLKMAK